jgi:N-methylhydantoinase A
MCIGPMSAGAMPGPVCYDQGGEVPTVTDANLILGYLNSLYLVGGALKLNAEKARAVFAERIAAPLGMSVENAAYGAHQVAVSNMIRAIRAVSTERGRDQREFALFAFGGNGPLFAAGMAVALGIRCIVVPPSPGLFSSFGLLYANIEHHYSRTLRRLLRKIDSAEIDAAWSAMSRQAIDQLAAEGIAGAQADVRRFAALHYKGQTFELVVPVPAGSFDARMVAYLEEAFGVEHEKTYGHRAGLDEPVELVSIQVVGSGLRQDGTVTGRVTASRSGPAPLPPRRAYFGDAFGWIETSVLRRSDLTARRAGPLIIEEYDATCLIPPGAHCHLDTGGNMVIEIG